MNEDERLIALKSCYCSPVDMEVDTNSKKSENSLEEIEIKSVSTVEDKSVHSSFCSPFEENTEEDDDDGNDGMQVSETDGMSISGPKTKKTFAPKKPPPIQPRARQIEEYLIDNKYYDMTHKKRGIALIFNHYEFKSMKARVGTHIDLARLENTLEKLDFKVIVKDDLKYTDVKKTIEKVSKMDHSEHDCFVTVMMSHGESNLLWAKDKKYPVEELYQPFFGDNCPTLIGKPKLFFIQACRGDKITNAVKYAVKIDHHDAPSKSEPVTYSIPSMSDLLVMYSTYEGHYSWRNPDTGSWFIQSLCIELDLHGKTDDLLTILTGVTRRVAYDFESNVPGNEKMHAKKQMPSIVSMLTKILYFTPKLK